MTMFYIYVPHLLQWDKITLFIYGFICDFHIIISVFIVFVISVFFGIPGLF